MTKGLLLVLLTSLVAPCVLWGQTRKPIVITPQFNWPVGLEAIVRISLSRRVSTGERTDSGHMTLRAEMIVDSLAGGRTVRFQRHEITSKHGKPSFNQFTSALTPGFVVSRSGESVSLASPTPEQRTMDSVIAGLQRLFDSISGGPSSAWHTLFSPQLFTEMARREWRAHVEGWLGQSLMLGVTYTSRADEPLPLVGDAVVPMLYEYAAQDTVRCTPTALRAECVRFVMTARPDVTSLRSVLLDMMTSLMPDSIKAMTELPELEMEVVTRLVAEPETMVPYQLETSQQMRVVVVSRTGRAETIGRETRLQTYRYPE